MSSTTIARAENKVNQGRAHLTAGRRTQAEECFRAAAKICVIPTALNNWALCRYLARDYSGALGILAPLVGGRDLAPYSRGLACLVCTAQGEAQRAHAFLQGAIRDFEAGSARPALRGDLPEATWLEYTTMIKRAAGELGEHRLVVNLHGRWPGQDLPQGAFLAGVAAFNLKRYEQAAKYWRRTTAKDWMPIMDAYAQVADLAERGVVPPFDLEYEPDYEWDKAQQDPKESQRLLAKGAVRVRMLALIFDRSVDEAETLLEALIGMAGQWGVELGQRILKGSTVPLRFKMAAGKALTDLGMFAPEQPIPITHEGRATTLVVRRMEVRGDSDPALDRKMAEAIRLRDRGRKDEALRLLTDLYMSGVAYAPAMVTLANLHRERGELEPARSLLELVADAFPEDPGVLFNLAGLWLQQGDVQRARAYVARIKPEGMGPEFAQHLKGLKASIDQMAQLVEVPDARQLGDAFREEIEDKPINPDITLRAALKQIPVQWLNAAAALHEIKPVARRAEREKLLVAALHDPARLQRLLGAEDPKVAAALGFLLANGGWSKLSVVTRRFGSLRDDGFWWDELPPASPLGRLRLLGLVFVGRTRIDGKAHKISVIPAELRPILAGCL